MTLVLAYEIIIQAAAWFAVVVGMILAIGKKNLQVF